MLATATMMQLFRLQTALSASICILPSVLPVLRHASSLAENIAQWKAKAAKELKGKDPDETLTHMTADVSSQSCCSQHC